MKRWTYPQHIERKDKKSTYQDKTKYLRDMRRKKEPAGSLTPN
jgi:hypothetical protein